MFLQRLTIENVRAIEHLDLSFHHAPDDPESEVSDRDPALKEAQASVETRQWTWLLGQNGCGKSTVLRSVALLLAGSDAVSELIGDVDSWVRRGQKRARLLGDLVTAKGEERHIEMEIRRGDGVRDVYARNTETLDLLDAAIEHADRNYFTVGYGGSRRVAGSHETSQGPSASPYRSLRAQSVATLFSTAAVLNSLEAWAMDLDYRQKGSRETIRQALRGLLPGVEFYTIDKKKRQLIFDTPDGRIPFDQLSDGYQNAASWAGDLLFRLTEAFPQHKDPFTARGLVLVDEIDLHLHPVWKRQLVDFLSEKLPNMQIVATTHSAVTVHQAGPGELFTLRRDTPEAPPTLHAYPGDPSTLLLHQLLMSPAFGLTTMDSRPVEALKEEYRALKSQKRRTKAHQEELEELRERLADVPEWSALTDRERRQQALLETIHAELSAGDGAGPVTA